MACLIILLFYAVVHNSVGNQRSNKQGFFFLGGGGGAGPAGRTAGGPSVRNRPTQHSTCYNINYNNGRSQKNSENLFLIFAIVT